MIILSIHLFRTPDDSIRQGLQFDVAFMLTRLNDLLPGVVFEDENYGKSLALMEKIAGPNSGALSILNKDANELGPSFPFGVPSYRLRGAVSRYSLSFKYDQSLPEEIAKAIEDFMASFGVVVSRSES